METKDCTASFSSASSASPFPSFSPTPPLPARSPTRDSDPSLPLLRVEKEVRARLPPPRKNRWRTTRRPSPSRRQRCRRRSHRPRHRLPRSPCSSFPLLLPRCSPLPRLNECIVVWPNRLIVMFICSARPPARLPFTEILTMIPPFLFREVDCCLICRVELRRLFSFVVLLIKNVAVGDGY